MESGNIEINTTAHPRESLEVALQGLSKRSKAIAGNIANINTPNYKRREVTFEETLRKVQGDPKLTDISLDKTDPRHISNEIFSIDQAMNSIQTKIDENDFFINGNNVDIEREMVELTKTGMKYKAITSLSKKQFDSLRSVIRGT